MRICVVYDCLFPHTVGGAERWYRNLAERLAADGHDVTYLTLRQWEPGEDPGVAGVAVRAVGPRMGLYSGPGQRRVLPPIVFGAGVFAHLLRHGRRYDVVHSASFPYFSLLAIALTAPLGHFRLVTDWHEVWTRAYWREYLGRLGGDVGWLVQRACIGVRQRAFCFSRLHAQRLRDEGFRREITILPGEYAGPTTPAVVQPAEPYLVFAGRLIAEKQVDALIPALGRVRAALPGFTARLYGDGPERERLRDAVTAAGLDGAIRMPGFVGAEEIELAFARALCMVLPSRREGYGMVVIEAASYGTPSIVVAGEDNAAVELVEEGVNGFVAASAQPEHLAEAVLRVHAAGEQLRRSTAEWFERNAPRLSLSRSVAVVGEVYLEGAVTP